MYYAAIQRGLEKKLKKNPYKYEWHEVELMICVSWSTIYCTKPKSEVGNDIYIYPFGRCFYPCIYSTYITFRVHFYFLSSCFGNKLRKKNGVASSMHYWLSYKKSPIDLCLVCLKKNYIDLDILRIRLFLALFMWYCNLFCWTWLAIPICFIPKGICRLINVYLECVGRHFG